MGTSYKLTCSNNCFGFQIVRTQRGMRHFNLDNCIEEFSEQEKHKIHDILANKKEKITFQFEFSAFQCSCCNDLSSKPYLRIFENGDEIYQTTYTCSDCNHGLNKFEAEELNQVVCDKCGKKSIESQVWMLWD